MCLLSLSDIFQIHYPLQRLLSVLYTQTTLCSAWSCSLGVGPSLSLSQQNPKKAVSLMSLSNCKNPYKNSADSFLSFSKARSRSQMHKAQVWQGGMQCKEGRPGALAISAQQHYPGEKNKQIKVRTGQRIYFSAQTQTSGHLLSQTQNRHFSCVSILHAIYSWCLVPSFRTITCSLKESLSVHHPPNRTQPGVQGMQPAHFQLH